MLRGMTAKQLLEWQEFDAIDPVGDVRLDYLAAQVAQMILLVHLGKGQKVPNLSELVQKWGQQEETKERDWRQMKAMTQMLAEAFKE